MLMTIFGSTQKDANHICLAEVVSGRFTKLQIKKTICILNKYIYPVNI